MPLNVMLTDVASDIGATAALGVARISFGPAPYLDALAMLVERYRSMLDASAATPAPRKP